MTYNDAHPAVRRWASAGGSADTFIVRLSAAFALFLLLSLALIVAEAPVTEDPPGNDWHGNVAVLDPRR